MRLTADEAKAIKTAANEVFGPDVIVRLFGSRLRDDVKGGDIDLHLEVDDGYQDHVHAGQFLWQVMREIGERPIDLVYLVRGREPRRIDRVAMEEGVRL